MSVSDSVSKFKAITSLTDMEVRKRHFARSNKGDEEISEEGLLYQKQRIVSEIYTNEHYDYLFNNGSLPDGHTSSDEEEPRKKKAKTAIDKKREKTSQYYRLKPPPHGMIQVADGQMTEG